MSRARPRSSAPAPALAALLLTACLAPQPARCAAQLPDTLTAPKGLNLGSTSFFDGFGRTREGWTVIEYGRYEDLTRINDQSGQPSPYFQGTHVTVEVALTQFCYASAWHPFGGDTVGFSAALPLIDFQSHFDATSPAVLESNGFNIGDLVWGPTYQSRVFFRDDRRYFSWRTQLLIASPTGAVNPLRNINQGAGFWAVNPYVTFTWLPFARIEISNRLNYQYNLRGSRFSDPAPIPGVTYVSGQAGEILYDNFDASFRFAANAYLGLNGYVIEQLTLDRTNGVRVPDSYVRAVYLGPGVRYVFGNSDSLNVNLYLKTVSENDTSGTKLNFQYIHRFH
jgi:hypothetical protein